MSWSAAFLAGLRSPAAAPRFILEVVEVWREPGSYYRCASHAGLGGDVILSARGVSTQGSTLSPRGWSSTIGSWSVQLQGDLTALRAAITRGTIVQLLCGWVGMQASEFEPIAIGQVRNLRWQGGGWVLDVLDLLSACRQRLDTSRGLHGLFSDLGTSTTLSADYTPGDTEIEVASTTGFARAVGLRGGLRVELDGGEFYLGYTSTATGPTRFSGVTDGVWGTTSAAAPAGTVVQEVALLEGHPLTIIRALLCSRGGGNGPYDLYPEQWGIGLLTELLDHADIDAWTLDALSVEGGYAWSYVQDDPVDGAAAWLSQLLSQAALFLTTRQGRITVRAAQGTRRPLVDCGIEITDADIEAVEGWEAWDQGHDVEYSYVYVQTRTANSGSVSQVIDAETLPQADTLAYVLGDRVVENEVAVAAEVYNRVRESGYEIPARLDLRCKGRRLAELANGDVVLVTTRQARLAYVRAPALVIAVSPAWSAATTQISLLLYPGDDDATG